MYQAEEHLLEIVRTANLDEEDIRQKISVLVNELIEKDFSRLLHVLYTIDVSETRLKESLASSPDVFASDIISQLIIDRLKEKRNLKQSHTTQPPADSDPNAW